MVKILDFVSFLGAIILDFFAFLGKITIFSGKALYFGFVPKYYFKRLYNNIVNIGFFSLPIVSMTALFAGMVLALQTYTGFARFSGDGGVAVASVVVISLTRELGPVMAGLMVAARMSSAIAAEISSMKVSEQLDVLYTMGVSFWNYIFSPAVIAGIICMPILVFIADVIGILGGVIVGINQLGIGLYEYMHQTMNSLKFIDVFSGLVKGAVFGFILTSSGCYCGFFCDNGASGVGKATTSAVVSGCILILIANYIITALFFGI